MNATRHPDRNDDHDRDDREQRKAPPAAVRDRCYVRRGHDCEPTLVVYDGENPLAWIESTVWIDLDT